MTRFWDGRTDRRTEWLLSPSATQVKMFSVLSVGWSYTISRATYPVHPFNWLGTSLFWGYMSAWITFKFELSYDFYYFLSVIVWTIVYYFQLKIIADNKRILKASTSIRSFLLVIYTDYFILIYYKLDFNRCFITFRINNYIIIQIFLFQWEFTDNLLKKIDFADDIYRL